MDQDQLSTIKWTTLSSSIFRILEMSDIHVNHPFVSHLTTIELISGVLLNPELLRKHQRIILAGDFYDHGMEYTDVDKVVDIEKFQERFLRKCKECDVQVRILRGTKSHDREQAMYFVKINDQCKIGCDLKYFDKLTVDIDERYGDSTLYIPDQWNVDASKTLKEAVTEMARLNLDKVDFGVMHGSMRYQMPEHMRMNQDLHDEKQYNDLVRYVLFIGHHHNASINGKIHCSGSPQRLRFGEEEDKGFLTAEIRPNGANVVFNVLKDAMPLLTKDCTGMSVEEVKDVIDKLIEKHPEQLGVRILGGASDPAASVVRLYQDDYPHLFFKFENKGQKDKKQLPNISVQTSNELIGTLTSKNIGQLLAKRIENKHPALSERVEQVMEEILDELGE